MRIGRKVCVEKHISYGALTLYFMQIGLNMRENVISDFLGFSLCKNTIQSKACSEGVYSNLRD